MGIIKRQSIKYTLANLLGVFVGMFSTLFIYPYDKEVVGLFRFLLDTSNIFVPLVLLGTPAVSTKFFPRFNDAKPGQRGFLFLLLLTVLVGFSLFSIASLGFETQIYDYFGKKSSPLYTRYIGFIVPLVFLYVIINLFKQYCANFGRVAIPSFLEQAIKLTFPVLLLLYLGHYINLDYLIYGIVIHFIVLTIITIVYAYHIGNLSLRPNFELVSKPLFKEIGAFALYSVIGSAGSMLALRIDTFMAR
jgi:Polysaccharide biosynthesis protein